MPEILDMLAAALGDKPALIHGERSWTYREHNARANALARGLADLGCRRGERLIWVGPNHEQVVLLGHAARKIGVVTVPLNYRFSPDEMAYVIDDSDATLVFCDPQYAGAVSAVRERIPKVREVVDYETSEKLIATHPPDPLPDDGAEGMGGSMIYTSGTSGQPKGALRTSVDASVVAAVVAELRLASDDVHVTTGPLYHSGPGGFATIAHFLGGTVVILPRFDPIEWLELVHRHRVTTTFLAPTQMKRIVNVDRGVRAGFDTSSLRSVIANAAPVPYSLKVQWIETFGERHLFEVYGSTELGVDTILPPEDQLRKPGSCGRPYGGIEIRLIREDGTEAPVGEPGEMWIRSPGAFDEYHKAPEKTEGTKLGDDPSWRSVGDVAYRDDEGYFYICDRKADMIISGGMNIYPAEIESVLHSHPGVMDAAVFGIPSDEWGESVHAVIQTKPDASVDVEALEALCRERLAGYKRPRTFEFRDELPRTDSGKLLKRVLRDEHWKGRGSKV